MKKSILLGLTIIATLSLVSCKSSESNYRKAYEKAQAEELNRQEQTEPVTVAPVVTPVESSATTTTNSNLRSERLEVTGGGTLRAYNVVCGSFKSQDNANNLRNTLVNQGYNAQVAKNMDNGMYRVIASSFDDRSSAEASRNALRSKYPDAWLLLRSY